MAGLYAIRNSSYFDLLIANYIHAVSGERLLTVFPRVCWVEGNHIYIRSVCTRFVLDVEKLRKLLDDVLNNNNGRCLWDVFIICLFVCHSCDSHCKSGN